MVNWRQATVTRDQWDLTPFVEDPKPYVRVTRYQSGHSVVRITDRAFSLDERQRIAALMQEHHSR